MAKPRTRARQDHVLNHLRDQILSGHYRPGARLPTRQQLQTSLSASSVTVQRALDHLVADGFVHARPRHGTFVADHPPHTCNYGLLFPARPTDTTWTRFWAALQSEALALHQDSLRVSLYHGMNDPVHHRDHDQAIRDVQARRFTGLIFACPPYFLADSPLLTQPGIPRVALLSPDRQIPGVRGVELDVRAFIDRALDQFVKRGRKRIAVITVRNPPWFFDHLVAAMAMRGLEHRPYWTQVLGIEDAPWARNYAHLLMHPQHKERPDGIFISDDNLVEHACAGLIAAGVRIPTDADVVTHCNFPNPIPSILPVIRIGYDARQILQTCFDILDHERRDRPRSIELIPPVVEGAISETGS